MKAPVLLIGFNRPDNMIKVFNQIRKAKPNVLYVAVDGPRESKENENEKCAECRSLANKVDWPCEVHTLFRNKNVGCALGVSEAISWAFENEDRLIILEDDCVPVLSFFSFCDEMLEKYYDDTRIWQVCGRSYHANSKFFKDSDYIFSRYAHIWGWATWKRCWSHYDLKMSDFNDFMETGGALNIFQTTKMGKRTNKAYKAIYKDIDFISSHTWDYQWSYTKLKNGALGIVPCKNLIENIGSASGAHSAGPYIQDIPTEEMPLVIRHPHFVFANKDHDIYHYHNHIHIHTSIKKRIIDFIYVILKKLF